MNQNKNKKKISGQIEKFKKSGSASTSAISLNLIKNIYSDAIEYKGIADGARGASTLFAFLLLSFVAYADTLFISSELEMENFSIFHFSLTVFFVFGGTTVTLYLFFKSLRFDLFRPIDEPIIFDRKNRKVYRIFRDVQPGWKSVFKRWPLKTATYDWNCISAEHHAAINADGSTITRIHALIFAVRKSQSDSTIIDTFTIGNSMQFGEVTVAAFYEHIRRFMEENGPHLPIGDTLSPTQTKPSIWQCLARTGPYGDTLKSWWVHHRILTLIGFVFFPILLPMMTFLGIFSWLSYTTATQIEWSNEVAAALGPPISFFDLGNKY